MSQHYYTEQEVLEILQDALNRKSARPNYDQDEMGEFHCDPNDPECREAMIQAGQTPPPIDPPPPPPPPGPPFVPPGGPGGGAVPPGYTGLTIPAVAGDDGPDDSELKKLLRMRRRLSLLRRPLAPMSFMRGPSLAIAGQSVKSPP